MPSCSSMRWPLPGSRHDVSSEVTSGSRAALDPPGMNKLLEFAEKGDTVLPVTAILATTAATAFSECQSLQPPQALTLAVLLFAVLGRALPPVFSLCCIASLFGEPDHLSHGRNKSAIGGSLRPGTRRLEVFCFRG